MVDVECHDEDHEVCFELRPNRSLSATGALLFFAATGCVCVTIALVCLYLGFWPVVPFTGLELAALGAALWWTQRDNRRRESIRIGAQQVIVERSGRRPMRVALTRCWVRVSLEPDASGRGSRLELGTHGRPVEIGGFLTEAERQALAGSLRARLRCGRHGYP